jgi:anaerobic selenocysteine-containing dehydrogenase
VLGIEEGDSVRVASRRGESVMNAKIDEAVKPGQLFIPMHYREANWLTYPAFDPYSFEPAYKSAAVRIGKAE